MREKLETQKRAIAGLEHSVERLQERCRRNNNEAKHTREVEYTTTYTESATASTLIGNAETEKGMGGEKKDGVGFGNVLQNGNDGTGAGVGALGIVTASLLQQDRDARSKSCDRFGGSCLVEQVGTSPTDFIALKTV
ncbi:hypothetical protein PHYPSEUDO_004915 [Phytophthora pseudosyringae]|uniref:Uncharacterized protein n=1 Tax=Phytophthora pseudosyringae TaxID=221518 RepID=A0A8T1WGX5_9STRA|nr:hypothetical protein PHYPSEUDO_004915 [Phytophthora pseudosyringae]